MIRKGWLWVRKHVVWVLLMLFALVIVVGFSAYADAFPQWTGLPEFDAGGGRLIRPKTFWDWLDLLIVGVVLAAGGFLLNRSMRNRELGIAEENRNQATLQAYYDKMADLILNHNLKDDEEGIEGRSIARARTLATLRSLDPARKGYLLRFLHESKLLDKDNPIVDLREADFTEANLSGAYLSKADLSNADLRQANLMRARLSKADLHKAKLTGADLRGANLFMADLREALLRGADLRETNINEANLSRADLRDASLRESDLGEADLRGADLSGADLSKGYLNRANLRRSSYNNETIWPDGFDPEAAGAILSGSD